MTDQKPPRIAGDEREVLLALLQYQRESLVRKVLGVDEDAARTSPVGSGTSLLWLLRHMAEAETLWIVHRFAGRDTPMTDTETMGPGALRDAVQKYEQGWQAVDAIVFGSSLDDVAKAAGDPPVNLRWIVMHLLEETARHAGHADILRELVDGQTGR